MNVMLYFFSYVISHLSTRFVYIIHHKFCKQNSGISSGLNLLRINKRIRIRHSIKHTLNSMKQRRSKGRRKKLANKFKQYVLGADYFDTRMSRKLGVIFESVDTDNSGTIDLAEYVSFLWF